MKTRHITFLFLAVTVFTAIAACTAIAEEEKPASQLQQHELTDRATERILRYLSSHDPEKATELKELREKNPEEFKNELKELVRDRFKRNPVEYRNPRDRQHGTKESGKKPARRSGEGRPITRRPSAVRGRNNPREMNIREKYREHLKWLEKNYPKRAERLTKLRKEKPQVYAKQMAVSMKKYARIQAVEKRNPKLAKVLKQDLGLKDRRIRLVRKIKAAKDKEEKAQLTAELEKVVSKRFGLIVKRKQIVYEQLSKKLENLKKSVKKRQAALDEWKNAKHKNQKVEARVKELLSDSDPFKWD